METTREAPKPKKVTYPPFAEAYIGRPALELLRLLDAVLEPYESILSEGLSTAQVMLMLHRAGLFEDLKIVRDIADAMREPMERKKRENIKTRGEERGLRQFEGAISSIMFPESTDGRPLRQRFVMETGPILYIENFLRLLDEACQTHPADPESVLRQTYGSEETHRRMEAVVYDPQRQALTLSSWLRMHPNLGDETMTEVDIPEDVIQGWKNASSAALQRIRGFQPKTSLTIAPLPGWLLPEIHVAPTQTGMEFEWAQVAWECQTTLDGWTVVALGLSAVNGHLGVMGVAGYASIAPIFKHHQRRDYYEFLRMHILCTLARDIEAHPENYEQIELPKKVEAQIAPSINSVEDDEMEITEDSSTEVGDGIDEATDSIREKMQEVTAQTVGLERRQEVIIPRNIKPREAVAVFERMGLGLFHGSKHTRVAGMVNGKRRTRNFITHGYKEVPPSFIRQILEYFGLTTAEFMSKL